MTKIIFRADGNSITGLGHLYRLFSLVEVVKETIDFVFLTKEDSVSSVIPDTYNLKTIPVSVSIAEEPNWIASNYLPLEYIIIADGYQFVSGYQKQIKEVGYKLIYIDDLATEHMYADVVINHSPHIKPTYFNREQYTRLALGTQYAMLRPLFLEAAKEKRIVEKIDTAFVCFGGSDSFNLTSKYVDALLRIKQFKKINIVVGAANENERFNEKNNQRFNRVEVFRNLSENQLLNLFKKCNFAVVPTSTIMFEILSVKMPIYSGYFVENQRKAFAYFKHLKCISGSGNMIKSDVKLIETRIKNYLNNIDINKTMVIQKAIIDGNQKHRFLELINSIN